MTEVKGGWWGGPVVLVREVLQQVVRRKVERGIGRDADEGGSQALVERAHAFRLDHLLDGMHQTCGAHSSSGPGGRTLPSLSCLAGPGIEGDRLSQLTGHAPL